MLLANSSYGYQIMNGSRQSVRGYKNDEKTHARTKKLFKRLGHINDHFCKVELAKPENEKEPISVGFHILQYAKFRMLEVSENFFTAFCDTLK